MVLRIVFGVIVAIRENPSLICTRNVTITDMNHEKFSPYSHTRHGRPSVRGTKNGSPRVRRRTSPEPVHFASSTPRERFSRGAPQERFASGTVAQGNGKLLLTRRQLLFGAAGVAAVAVAGSAVYMTSKANASSDDVTNLTVAQDSVVTSDDCEFVEDAGAFFSLAATAELPYGTLVWTGDSTIAVCLVPTETASPLAKVGVLNLASATLTNVLEQAIGSTDGFEIYDVRGNSHGLVWTEAQIFDGTWRVYQAPYRDGALGEAILADEGDANWEMPTLAAVGNHAFWQVMPRTDGSESKGPSVLKRVAFGDESAEDFYTSPGRMACPPTASADAIIIAPRTDTSSVHYQLTSIDAQTGEIRDALVLPSSMRPYEVSYGANGFIFAFDAIYDFGGGISNLGTYTPLAPVPVTDADYETDDEGTTFLSPNARTEAYSNATWFRYGIDPSAAPAPAWCGDWMMLKTQTQVSGIGLASMQRIALEGKSGAADYGDYLASCGICDAIVTYSNIDYTPLEGEAQKCCFVRIWQPVSSEPVSEPPETEPKPEPQPDTESPEFQPETAA